MNVPSEKAQSFAEEMLDFVRHGLTRADTVREIAEMFDEVNGELVHSVEDVLHDAESHSGHPDQTCLTKLKRSLHDYEPLHTASDPQTDLFSVNNGQPAAIR